MTSANELAKPVIAATIPVVMGCALPGSLMEVPAYGRSRRETSGHPAGGGFSARRGAPG